MATAKQAKSTTVALFKPMGALEELATVVGGFHTALKKARITLVSAALVQHMKNTKTAPVVLLGQIQGDVAGFDEH